MSHSGRLIFTLVALVAVLATSAEMARAQANAQPNSQPNPYQTIEGWAKMPEGRTWGATSAVEIDRDGKSIWVAERCGANSCADSNLPSILKFDATGKLVKSFGEGMLRFPHGIHVDKDGNVWVTDGQGNRDPARGGRGATPPATPQPPKEPKGHQVFKFSPEGKLLMTLGKPGGAQEPEYFFNPNDVLVAPNGDIFVSEGHGGPNSRILKFSKDGKFIKAWGKKGSAQGEFDQPHALAMDSKGRLFVGDRTNNRIQIFDQDGKFIAEWKQFGRPSGLYIDKKDVLYVADSESNDRGGYGQNPGWKRGIRIGSAKDGTVWAFIPDPSPGSGGTSAAEGVAADAAGNVYGAEVGPRALKKYVKK
jgi:sugar lactone lactonase YvrE